jgi:tRNA pseudouridine38-40 synthase
VEADAFCHTMVRALVGALLAVGEGRRPTEWPALVLRAAVRDPAVAVVPPYGLTLEEVRYPDTPEELAARAAESRHLRA